MKDIFTKDFPEMRYKKVFGAECTKSCLKTHYSLP